MDVSLYGLLIAVFIVLLWFWNSIYVIKEWERGVVLRLGRMQPSAKGPVCAWYSGPSRSCIGSRCGSKRSTCLRKTSSRATTSR